MSLSARVHFAVLSSKVDTVKCKLSITLRPTPLHLSTCCDSQSHACSRWRSCQSVLKPIFQGMKTSLGWSSSKKAKRWEGIIVGDDEKWHSPRAQNNNKTPGKSMLFIVRTFSVDCGQLELKQTFGFCRDATIAAGAPDYRAHANPMQRAGPPPELCQETICASAFSLSS